jgi:hypothetical protein
VGLLDRIKIQHAIPGEVHGIDDTGWAQSAMVALILGHAVYT